MSDKPKTPKRALSKAAKPPVRHFAFDLASESFIISNLDDNTEIVIPTPKALFKGAGCIHPGKLFAVLGDGSKLCVENEKPYSHYSQIYTVSNQEAGWLLYGRQGEGGQMLMDEDESLRGKKALYFVNPETYSFTLFDLKNNTQYSFGAVILDHADLARRHSIEEVMVAAQPLAGRPLGYNWFPASALPDVAQRFLKDFDAKYERSREIAGKGIFSQPLHIYSGHREPSINGMAILLRGNVDKGEPLLTLEKFWAPLKSDYYGEHSQITSDILFEEPSEKIEFYGVCPTDKPVREQGHISLYRVMGGLAIVDTQKREHYYVLGKDGRGMAYIRTVDNLEKIDVADAYGTFEICSLAGPGQFDLNARGGQNPMFREIEPVRNILEHYSDEEMEEELFALALVDGMPASERLLRPEEKKTTSLAVQEPLIDFSQLTEIRPRPY